MPIFFSRVVPLLAAALLSACASTPRQPVAAAPKAAVSPSLTVGPERATGERQVSQRASRDIKLPRYVVEHRYDDAFRIDGKDIAVTVEFGFDYDKAVTVQHVFLRDGTPYSQRDLPGVKLMGTEEEMDLAFALAREHPQLSKALAQPNLSFYGGFAYYEATDPACGERSRCVHVIVTGGYNNETTIAHAIVDLVQRRVVHPFYGVMAGQAVPQQASQ